jgi:CheY-like chemotaxis protein
MPVMDGIEATRMFKELMQKEVIPFIPIIGLTAFTSREDLRNCLEAGMFEVLSKPFNIREF